MRINHGQLLLLVPCLVVCLSASMAYSQSVSKKTPPDTTAGWTGSVRGGGIVQTDTNLDNGGSFRSSRLNIEAGPSYRWSRSDAASLTFSYTYDGYDFSGSGDSMASRNPWGDVHTLMMSAPIRYAVNREWSTFLVPSVRSSGESGADFSDTVSGAVLTGVSYRFGDRLTIGPGIGVVGQIEESATVFPLLIINWKITDTISLETGRGLAATLGPGLHISYRPSGRWTFMLGGRYEKLRFRLNSDAAVPGGVGQDTALPLFGGCTYQLSPKGSISFVAGIDVDGDLRLEDENGDRIGEESYVTAPFIGLTFNLRI